MRGLGPTFTRVCVLVTVATGVPTLVAAGLVPAAARAASDVRITFEGNQAGSSITEVVNAGSADVDVAVLTARGGTIVARQSAATGSIAADFPAYDGTQGGPRAVLSITNPGSADRLEPGTARFTFGADVKLDAVNDGGDYDDGNNVVQRGRFTDTSQFKLQIDAGKASCRVAGAKGAVRTFSSAAISTGTWYRLSCARQVLDTGDRLVVKVTPIAQDGTLGATVTTTSSVAPIGRLKFADQTPLSVGGKLDNKATIAASADQLNGVVDNVFLDMP